MSKKTVGELIAEAAEAAKLVPENLQEIAFSKAFDALSEAESTQTRNAPLGTKSKKKKLNDSSKDKEGKGVTLDALDRTAHPEINHDQTGLDNSLRLLKAARDDLGIDGLTAAEIARVLTEKFRARISRQAVGMALNDAGRYVNRHKEGSAVMFQIMGPGESYLDTPKEAGVRAPTKGNRTKKNSSPKPKATKKVETHGKKATKPPSKSKRRVGPDAALHQLYDNGFFSSAKTIGNIIEELKHSHGRAFKSSEMSPVLLRYLRNGNLKREKNQDNQYEYSKP